jgi:predicted kinase
VVSTDDVRRQLQAAGLVSGETGTLNAGLYTPQQVSAVYDEVLRRARALLAEGRPVILDGTWRDPVRRRQARELAVETSSPIVEFVCAVPVGSAVDRVATRGPSASDATPQIAAELSDAGTDWPDAQRLDTSRPLGDTVAEAQRVCLAAI